jgi:isohexenylglutaconyl-CoA hydratase
MTDLPVCETLDLRISGGRLDMMFNRPERRNAINARMSQEIAAVVDWLYGNQQIRVVTVRGAGGHFCSGGDIKERRAMVDTSPADGSDPVVERNYAAGLSFLRFEQLPQTTISVVEGSAFGGGFGYACLTDLTIVADTSRMGMPETRLGVAPAQIAPYVVKRIGLTRARQLALTGERIDGATAFAYGVAQYLCGSDELDATVEKVVAQVLQCGPAANAATKAIMLQACSLDGEEMVRFAADQFGILNHGPEGREGQSAFIEKRRASWQVDPQ